MKEAKRKKKTHPNIKLLQELNLKDRTSMERKFSKSIIWRFFNPVIPEISGDYKGIDGILKLFQKLEIISFGSFKYESKKHIPIGDELIISHVNSKLQINGTHVGFDTVLVCRIINNKITEIWNIPSVYDNNS
ncbi:hypothetical protein [Arenibacter palladensis]|nr:hypothetical protein [Arenibacter palladensis]